MNEAGKINRSAIYAEEAFVVDVQSFLHRTMEEKNISRTQLAAAMGVSKARISQIFSDECKNFTVRLLARACHALGEEPRISSGTCDRLDRAQHLEEQAESINSSKNVHKLRKWCVDDWMGADLDHSDKASESYGRTLVQTLDGGSRDQARMAVN